jgi:hypothetical protein
MLVHEPWFRFPIARHAEGDFYKETDRRTGKAVARVDAVWASFPPGDRLVKAAKLRAASDEFRGPWPYSDLAGFVVVGADHGNQLAGDVLLKRIHFPRSNSEDRVAPDRMTGLRGHREIVLYAELGRWPFTPGRNESYVTTIKRMLRRAEIVVRRRIRGAVVCANDFDLGLIDFVGMDRRFCRE